MNKLAILVVTYNRKELLKENMAAIFNQTCQEFDYYICDNASTDGTESIVKEQMRQHANLYYYNTGKNLGGAGGFSYGLKMIAQKDYDFCWLMDDDSIPQSDALEALARAADTLGKESFSYLGSTVLWMDGTPCVMNQFVPGTNVYDNLRATQNGLIPIEYGSFVGCFVNLLYTRKVGLPIKEFFIYGDDTEYTLRLHKEKPAYMCLYIKWTATPGLAYRKFRLKEFPDINILTGTESMFLETAEAIPGLKFFIFMQKNVQK